jgi:Putative peptidoglycan binding domain/Transglycosylase SLT domain
MTRQHMVLMLNDGISNKAIALINEVKILQQVLKDWGMLATAANIDGEFGGITEDAVKLFQSKRPLIVDGIVGQKTWAALLRVEPFAIEMISRPGFDTTGINLNKIPNEWKFSATPYVPTLVKAFQDGGISDSKVLAYACATIGNESSWNPAAENRNDAYAGTPWSGKGLAQITTPENYKALALKTGIDFVNHPNLMFDPYNSLRAKAAFYEMNGMIPYIVGGDYESAAGIYNAGDPNFRSSYTRGVAEDTPQWLGVFS